MATESPQYSIGTDCGHAAICLTKSNILIMASEAGVLETPAHEIIFQGRLKPGEMFLADTLQNRIVPEQEIFDALDEARLRGMADAESRAVERHRASPARTPEELADVTPYQRAFGYTLESLRCLVQPMAEEAKDPLGSMGNDTPLAVLSARHKPLFQYFLQLFAQVSNPPLDYLREGLVTSLESHIGRQRNLLEETPKHCRQLFLDSPILTLSGCSRLSSTSIETESAPCSSTPLMREASPLEAPQSRFSLARGARRSNMDARF